MTGRHIALLLVASFAAVVVGALSLVVVPDLRRRRRFLGRVGVIDVRRHP